MRHCEAVTTYCSSRSLSTVLMKKAMKTFQPKQHSRKRDPKKSQAAIITAEENM